MPQILPLSPDNSLPAGVTHRASLGPGSGRLHRGAWSPDGRFLALPGEEHRLRVIGWPSLAVERERPLDGPAWSAAFSADGRLLAMGQAAAEIALWEWQGGSARRLALPSRTSAATALFLPDGTLVTGSGKGRLYVWDLAAGQLAEPKIEAHAEAIYALALSPDGTTFATASGDATLALWAADSRLKSLGLRGHTGSVYAAAWSPDDRWLASASADSTIRLWNPETGAQVGLLTGHTAAVVGVSVSADGRLLASKSLDGTVRLWRTDTWQSVAELPATADPRNPFGLLAFHPRETILAAAGDGDRRLDLWTIDTDRLLEERQATPPKPARRNVFVSYSHKDRGWLDRLKVMADPLIDDGTVDWWDDSEIKPGAQWRAEIERALATAKVAVLLVSPEFLASPFIKTQELPQLLAAAKSEGLILLWVHVRSCLWKRTAIEKYQAAHDVDRPLFARLEHEQDDELLKVAEQIEKALARN
jgi:dipeptidyl aminopeptidase/acylaminoacyl peptidase